MTKDLRVEARFRNNVLWHAIYDQWPSVAAFCRASGVKMITVLNYLNLRLSPWDAHGPKQRALQVAEFLKTLPEDLYPRQLYAGVLPRQLVNELASTHVLSLLDPDAKRACALLPAETWEGGFVPAAIQRSFSVLKPRLRRILELRYGLQDGHERTFEEIGQILLLSGNRVRDLHNGALWKLRDSKPIRELRGVEPWQREASCRQ